MAKSQITCKLHFFSLSKHLQQLLSGFSTLSRLGIIDLHHDWSSINKLRALQAPQLFGPQNAYLKVTINNEIHIIYDTRDTYEVNFSHLESSDFYFKRSFSKAHTNCVVAKIQKKIFPLGHNYLIYPDHFDLPLLLRHLLAPSKLNRLLGFFYAVPYCDRFRFTPRGRTMSSVPNPNTPPQILFMTRAWDPKELRISDTENTHRIDILNSTRAECIKLLKEEFGPSFFGGFAHTEYAKTRFPQALIDNPTSSSKKKYITSLREYPICVATKGLQDSVGWKFGEYLAFSKAIISEEIDSEAPGNLANGVNYLEFKSPTECLNAAKQLVDDRELRTSIMTNNFKYYHQYLRPDVLILNTIFKALSNFLL